ncbi:hypothetical protein Tco_0996314 [Tanacetum coccineum]
MLERSTGIAGVTKATLGPELVPSGGKDQQSRTASPLRRQGPAGQEQLVSSGGKDQPVKNSYQSRTASPLGRQGAALSPSELVHWRLTYDVRISQTSDPQQVLEHEDNFDPEDKV